MKRGKKYRNSVQVLDREKEYPLDEAVRLVKEMAYAKFNEGVDMAVRLGVDTRKSEQMVRGSLVLPHGLGKKVTVLVFAKGEKVAEARNGGADHVGGEELVEKIEGGWMDFDRVIATPDMMKTVGRLGKVLGTRGLMPSPKKGTVTFELAGAISDAKAGQVDYRVDKGGVIHCPIGRVEFEEKMLVENALTLMDSIVKARPASAKGTYIRRVFLSSTMGPGIKIDRQELLLRLQD